MAYEYQPRQFHLNERPTAVLLAFAVAEAALAIGLYWHSHRVSGMFVAVIFFVGLNVGRIVERMGRA